MKKNIFIIVLFTIVYTVGAQHIDNVFFNTSEKKNAV